jgi:hypothetical protein
VIERILSLLFVFAFVGCSALKSAEPVKWPDAVQCVPDTTELVAEVSQVLLDGGSVTDKLTELARKHTPKAVVCVVDLLLQKWPAPGAAASPQRAQGVEAGQKFLSEVGTRVTAPE